MTLASSSLVALVATANASRALSFYRDTLGLSFIADDDYAVVFDANHTMLRIQKVETLEPRPFTVLGWRVEDIAATIRDLTSHGVTFERYPFIEQDDEAVWHAPGGTAVAWFKDPDGNLLSLTQFPA